MDFLANENFPAPSTKILREKGHKVVSIQEIYSGITDVAVLNIAAKEHLIILTFDKDYGELIYRNKYPNPPSVIFFRLKGINPEAAAQLLLSYISADFASRKIAFNNCFSAIDESGLKQKLYSTL